MRIRMTAGEMKWTGVALLAAWLWAQFGLLDVLMGIWLVVAVWFLVIGWVKGKEER